MPDPAPRLRVIGAGRAGRSLAGALSLAGWQIAELLGRGAPVEEAARDVDVLVIATPDAAIAPVALRVAPRAETLVVHLSGAVGLDALAGHPRRAGLHPLVSMPDERVGAERLRADAWFGIAGDPAVSSIVDALGGRSFPVRDEDRAVYHAAACVASNHLVALMGQVERLAGAVGVPLEAYLDLARESLANVAAMGPAAALTGPVARGDEDTVDTHRRAIDPRERAAYDALADAARRLARARGGEHA